MLLFITCLITWWNDEPLKDVERDTFNTLVAVFVRVYPVLWMITTIALFAFTALYTDMALTLLDYIYNQ